MFLFIFVLVVAVVALFLLGGGILLWVEKILKIENRTYKNALKTSTFYTLVSATVGLILGYLKLGVMTDILAVVAYFFIFHYFLKKYHNTVWRKSLATYLVFGVTNIVIGFFILIPFKSYIVQSYVVSGQAMVPTYQNGDYLIISKLDKSFKRGDVVVFRYPKDPSKFFIKRIIALPLEKIDIQSGKVSINGQVLEEDYYKGETLGDSSITLGADQYFVLGDNRTASSDSREWGPITKSSIEGKIFYKVPGISY